MMTSTYDALGALLCEVRKTPEIASLIARVCECAIDEISKVNPEILNWDDWSKRKGNSKEFYGGTLNQVASFFSDAHTLLDHTKKYHLRTVNQRLDYIIGRFKDWFVWYKDREYSSRFYRLGDFKPKTIRIYPKIFKELKKLIDSGFIKIPDWDKRTKKKVAKW